MSIFKQITGLYSKYVSISLFACTQDIKAVNICEVYHTSSTSKLKTAIAFPQRIKLCGLRLNTYTQQKNDSDIEMRF